MVLYRYSTAQGRQNGVSIDFFVQRHDEAIIATYTKSLSFIPHLHSQIEMIYVISGSGEMTVEGETHILMPGEAALCWPNRVHSYRALDCGSLYCMGIIDPARLGKTGEEFSHVVCKSPYINADKVHPDVPLALERMINESDMPPALKRAYAIIASGRLMAGMDLVPNNNQDNPDTLHKVLAYIDNNLSNEISLDGMARALYMNKYYISKSFSRHMNCSMHTYINALRVKRAQGLLDDASLDIDSIMSACGYTSERTFYRAFKAHTGLTPKQYREDRTK